MPSPEARYELRVVAPALEAAARELEARLAPAGEQRSDDLYLVGPRADRSVKVRNAAIEIKRLLDRHGDLERWQADDRLALPLGLAAQERVLEVLDPAAAPVDPASDPETVAREALQAWLGRHAPAVVLIEIRKHRRLFETATLRAEHVRLEVRSHRLESVAIESVDPDAVRALRAALHLDAWPNVSYPSLLHGLPPPETAGRDPGGG